jgi:hypothetical protein
MLAVLTPSLLYLNKKLFRGLLIGSNAFNICKIEAHRVIFDVAYPFVRPSGSTPKKV